MKKLTILILLLTASLFANENKGQDVDKKIIKIEILNKDFKVINRITDSLKVEKFKYYWDKKHPIKEESHMDYKFKIDISFESTPQNKRWLYSANGFTYNTSRKTNNFF
jgi:hypothetical protein